MHTALPLRYHCCTVDHHLVFSKVLYAQISGNERNYLDSISLKSSLTVREKILKVSLVWRFLFILLFRYFAVIPPMF